jgi:hypothetical protein
MEAIVAAIYDSDKPLWYAELKRTVEGEEYLDRKLTEDTFASAIRKLREISYIEKRNSLKNSKKKKIPIRLTPEFKKTYIFGDIKIQTYSEKTAGWTKSGERYKFGDTSIPNTYLPESHLRDIKPRYLTGGDTKRGSDDSEGKRRARAISYFLLRASFGTIYHKLADRTKPKPGQIMAVRDRRFYYTPYDTDQISSEDVNLDYIPYECDSLSGVSIQDLVERKDAGSSGMFRNADPSKHRVKRIMKNLVREGVMKPLAPNTNENETRYIIANKLLEQYIQHWGTILTDVLTRMERSWMLTSRTDKELEWYQYYVSITRANAYLEYSKRQKRVVDDEEELEKRDQSIRSQIKDIFKNSKYKKIEKNYPGLVENIKTLLQPVSKKLKIETYVK